MNRRRLHFYLTFDETEAAGMVVKLNLDDKESLGTWSLIVPNFLSLSVKPGLVFVASDSEKS